LEFYSINLPDQNLLFFTILVISVGGILRGFMGFGPALLTIPMLAFIYSPIEALVIHIIMEIPSTLFLMPNALKHSQKNDIFPMFIAMAITIPLGMYLVVLLDPQIIRRTISIIVLLLIGMLSYGWSFKQKIGLKTMIASGSAGGLVQGIAGMGGPPIVTILLARGDSPDISRSNILLLMAGIVFFSIASQLFYKLMTIELVIIGFLASPVYILTTFIGSKFYNSRGKRVFKRIALLLLALIAISTFIASFN